jgi:hypothetical protein
MSESWWAIWALVCGAVLATALIFISFKMGYELGAAQDKPKKISLPKPTWDAGNLLDPVTPADQRAYAHEQKLKRERGE